MARVGLAKEQLAKGGGLNFGKGRGEIIDAVVVNHQFPANKQTGDQEELRPKIRLKLIRLDANWKPTGEDEIEEYIPLGGKGSMAKFHPGDAKGPDDEEPEDLGDEDGAEGNSIFTDDQQISVMSKAGIFTTSLEDAGFKPEYLNGYMPNLIGLQASFASKKMQGSDGMKDWEVFLVDTTASPAIHKFPYQKGGVTKAPVKQAAAPAPKAAAGKATAHAPAPVNGKASVTATKKAVEAVESTDGPDDEVVGFANQILTAIGESKSGETLNRAKEGPPASRLATQTIKFLSNLKVPPAHHTAVKNLIESDWLTEAGAELGWEVSEGAVVVP